MLPGETVHFQPIKGTVALDGEREIELFQPDQSIDVTLNPHGPFVVDIPVAINLGAHAGAFTAHYVAGTITQS